MKIYNTLNNKKEEFIPINPPNVSIYVCGPTVYDYFHIGNARSFIMADVIRRYLKYKGYKVKYVMNLTDVDDKIIKKANEEGISAAELSQRYIDAFLEDIKKLKVDEADNYPKATENMTEMIDMVKTLESKGFAYNKNGDVFYNVLKFDGYGKLSGKNTEQLESGSRIEINDIKNNPLDFSLWKKAKEGEPYWESPWGKGRPGWHLECSTMSMKHLGKTIDIHAGGNDLIFPHHENEIAQSEACCTNEFVRFWIHFGFLNLHDEKMSKSLGNFFTAREILKQFSAYSIRLLFNQTHYRSPLAFSKDLLTSAEKGLEKIFNLSEEISSKLENAETNGETPDFDFANYYTQFENAMDDDFNTSQAVAVIFDFVKNINKVISNTENLSVEFFGNAKQFLQKTAVEVLGIIEFDIKNTSSKSTLDKELIQVLIDLRLQAKADKNYNLSDQIRDKLGALGIELKDTKDGTTYTQK